MPGSGHAQQSQAFPPEDVQVGRAPVANRFAAAAVFGMLVLIGLYRIPPVDVPWHLATGRLILATGHFPTTNTFSWTYPDFTLNQQYPLWQVPLALIVDHLGWEWVTAANCAGWTLAVLAWLGWVGVRQPVEQPLLTWLVVMGVQRHHVARPEVFTVAGLGLLLWSLDRVRLGDRRFIALGIGTTWMMVNGHQMWTLGLALQLSFLVHLGLVRVVRWRWVSEADRAVPFAPFLTMFVGSLLVCMVSPLGPGVFLAPFTTIGTLLSQGMGAEGGAMARELAPVWHDPLSFALVVAAAGVAAVWVPRSKVEPFELAVLAMGAVLVAAAIRGTPFAILSFATVAMRSRARAGSWLPERSVVHVAGAVTAVVLSLQIAAQVFRTPVVFHRLQFGFGRTYGEWADDAMAFLRSDPPPGEMLNLGWVAGNPLIEGLYPIRSVFVDPRWEAYPRSFLLDSIRACEDGAALDALVTQWRPGFIVAEVPDALIRERVGALVRSGQWRLVYADTLLAVLVGVRPDNVDYLVRHPAVDLATWIPADLASPDQPLLLAQQQVRTAEFLRVLGERERASEWAARARAHAEHSVIAEALETFPE